LLDNQNGFVKGHRCRDLFFTNETVVEKKLQLNEELCWFCMVWIKQLENKIDVC